MKTLACTMFALALAAPAAAQSVPPSVPFAQALDGAVSVAAMPQGFLIVVRPEGSLVCALNIGPEYFVALMAGDGARAAERRPAAYCVAATEIGNLGSPP